MSRRLAPDVINLAHDLGIGVKQTIWADDCHLIQRLIVILQVKRSIKLKVRLVWRGAQGRHVDFRATSSCFRKLSVYRLFSRFVGAHLSWAEMVPRWSCM